MTNEGYADRIMNNRPGFHSDIPVSELTERVTRAIEASDVSSVETADGVTITKTSQPSTGPLLRVGAQGKMDSQGDRMYGRRIMAQILGRGYVRKLRLVLLSSPQSSVTPDPSNGKGSGLTRGLIRVYIHPSCVKGIYVHPS